MSRYRKLSIIIYFLLVCLSFSYNAYGYIDPGTASALYGVLAPLFSVVLFLLAFLTRPFRRFIRFVINKFKKEAKSETNK